MFSYGETPEYRESNRERLAHAAIDAVIKLGQLGRDAFDSGARAANTVGDIADVVSAYGPMLAAVAAVEGRERAGETHRAIVDATISLADRSAEGCLSQFEKFEDPTVGTGKRVAGFVAGAARLPFATAATALSAAADLTLPKEDRRIKLDE